jgi:hypothetical protein
MSSAAKPPFFGLPDIRFGVVDSSWPRIAIIWRRCAIFSQHFAERLAPPMDRVAFLHAHAERLKGWTNHGLR